LHVNKKPMAHVIVLIMLSNATIRFNLHSALPQPPLGTTANLCRMKRYSSRRQAKQSKKPAQQRTEQKQRRSPTHGSFSFLRDACLFSLPLFNSSNKTKKKKQSLLFFCTLHGAYDICSAKTKHLRGSRLHHVSGTRSFSTLFTTSFTTSPSSLASFFFFISPLCRVFKVRCGTVAGRGSLAGGGGSSSSHTHKKKKNWRSHQQRKQTCEAAKK
jgi:hypothetical protein